MRCGGEPQVTPSEREGRVSDVLSSASGVARVSESLGPLLSGLAGCKTVEDVMAEYLRHVRALVPCRGVGIYLSRGAGRPPRSMADGVSEAYLELYEELGRGLDPVLQYVMESGKPVSSSQLMAPEDWQASAFYQEVLRIHGFQSTLKAPILANDRILGTLNFGDREADTFADAELVDVAGVLGRVVGSAVIMASALEDAQWDRDQLLQAFEATSDALIVTDLRSGLRRPNAAARRVLSLLSSEETDLLLEDLLAAAGGASGSEKREYGTEVRVVTQAAATPKDRRMSVTRLDVPPEEGTPRHMTPFAQALLSPRERQVAAAVSLGLHDQQIAESLVLSVHTVKQHLKSIYKKLGVNSRVELTRLVLMRRSPEGTRSDGPDDIDA